MRTCPFCAGDVQDDASVCRHCGRNLPERSALPISTPILVLVGVAGLLLVLSMAFCGTPR
jgi:hypothetical protein